jgi:hypothetical protein
MGKYIINVYYGGEMEDEVFYTDNLFEAKKISQQGEHSEIYDNVKKVFIEEEYANGGMIQDFEIYDEQTGKSLFIKARSLDEAEGISETIDFDDYEKYENYNVEIAKPHPIAKAPKLDKLNKPIGFTDAEFRISNPDILKQETTIVFGGLFLSILKYLELLNPKHAEMMTQALNSSIPIPYSTKNKKGEEVKIALTGIENFDIFKHLFVRISDKSSQLDLIKNQIENAKTPEELEKINVNF